MLRIALLVALLVPALQDRPEKSPVPEEAELKRAERITREVFQADYKKKNPEDRVALAVKLMDRAQEKNDPARRFVLLREARDLAAQGLDVDLSMRAIAELDAAFVVDVFEMKSTVLATAAKEAKGADLTKVAEAYLRFAAEAVTLDRYPDAEKAVAAASALAKRAKDAELRSRVEARSKEVADGKAGFADARKAEETLAANADDPAANLALGRYRAIVKGNWAAGLPLLAKSSDEALRDLATKELANPSDPAEQGALGDSWWDRAEKETGSIREGIRLHAAELYARALESGLAGLERTKAEKRMVEVRSARGGGWEDVTNPALFGLQGGPGDRIEVGTEGREGLQTLQKFPQGQFDGVSVRMNFGRKRGARAGILVNNEAIGCAIDPAEGLAAVGLKDGNGLSLQQAQVPKKDEYVINILIRAGEYVVYINGDPKFKAKAASDTITDLSIRSDGNVVTCSEVRLRYKK